MVIGALIVVAGIALLMANVGTRGASSAPPMLNGSLQYAPAVLAFAGFTVVAFVRRHPLRWWVAGAGAVFLASLTARTLDIALCAAFPLGLHWIWHLLNGLVVGLVLQILIRSPRLTPAWRGSAS